MLERCRDTTPRAQHSQVGQLALHADRFAALLEEQGYAPVTVREKLQLLGDLSRWLKRRKLQATDLDEQRVGLF
jgi:integrase/recombinase XerD